MSAKKGTCKICDRENVTILMKDTCASCYPLGRKFSWDTKKMREYRKSKPVKTRGGGKEPHKSEKKKEPEIKLETSIAYNEARKIKVEFELEVKITNVHVVGYEK